MIELPEDCVPNDFSWWGVDLGFGRAEAQPFDFRQLIRRLPRFNVAPAGGAYAGWRADIALLAAGAPVLCLGYGAEFHSGDEMLAVRAPAAFTRVVGAFLESTALTFEGGMSGGPILSEVTPDDFRVVGIVVAGSDSPPAAGIRALDAAGAAFIAGYLRY